MRWISLVLLFCSFSTFAAAPSCYELSSGNYCNYKGKVQRVYINDSGLILVYFDADASIEGAAAVGFSISQPSAGGYLLQTNADFAKLLYSTALAAKASGSEIGLQMRGTVSGYLKIDRIWMD